MKKFREWSKAHNVIRTALILFWLVDFVFTAVKMFKGWSTMPSVERKFVIIDGMIDMLWIFVLSVELTLGNAVSKLYDSYLELLDFLISVAGGIKATTKKPEGLEDGVALSEES